MLPVLMINPILKPRTKLSYWSKAKERREKGKKGNLTVEVNGTLKTGNNGQHTQTIKPTIGLNRMAKAKAEARAPREQALTQKNFGATYTNSMDTRRTGAIRTPTGQTKHHHHHQTYGVRHATDKDTPPTIASPHPSRSHQKEKGKRGTLATATGKAKISLQPTTPIRLLPPYTTSHHRTNRYGGKIMNWDRYL